MSHVPTYSDVKTDILRAIHSTYSPNGLKDKNFKFFLRNALNTLETLVVDKRKKNMINDQIIKSRNIKKGINKVREDLLLINSLL